MISHACNARTHIYARSFAWRSKTFRDALHLGTHTQPHFEIVKQLHAKGIHDTISYFQRFCQWHGWSYDNAIIEQSESKRRSESMWTFIKQNAHNIISTPHSRNRDLPITLNGQTAMVDEKTCILARVHAWTWGRHAHGLTAEGDGCDVMLDAVLRDCGAVRGDMYWEIDDSIKSILLQISYFYSQWSQI